MSISVHFRARDGQRLEEVHPPPREEHEAAPDEGDLDDSPADLRLRRVQDLLTSGE